jgi:NAD(P)H-nitrite reductase large subunit
VSDVSTEMQDFVRTAAMPVMAGELIGSQIARAARRLGLSKSRAKALWYGEARRIDAHEYMLARNLYEAKLLKGARDAAAANETARAAAASFLARENPFSQVADESLQFGGKKNRTLDF